MIRRLLLSLAILFAPLLLAAPAAVNASTFGDITSPGCASAPESPVCKEASKQGTTNPVSGKNGVLQKAANLIAIIAGIGAVIVIIFGGISLATGGGSPAGQRAGDPNSVKKARAMIVNASIGLIVIALAWAIVSFVIQHVVSS